MTDNPQTEAARRERYATAIRETDGWVLDDGQHMIDAVMAVADAELAARRAADLRDAEEICDEAGASYTAKALNEQADGAYGLMARFRRKAEEAEQTAAATSAVPVPPTTHAGDRAAPVDWVDGHPQLEAIAAAVWEQCRTEGTSLVVDDPRNIAVAALGAMQAAPLPADEAAVLLIQTADLITQRADDLWAPGSAAHAEMLADAAELRRMADEAQQQPVPGPGRVADEEQGETVCAHSFPDPHPEPVEQIGDCRYCGVSYLEAKRQLLGEEPRS